MKNYAQYVKDKADTFDIDVHKCLTRKQTNEVKAHPDQYHFLPTNSTFDFLDLHTNLFYDMDFRVVRLKSQMTLMNVSSPISIEKPSLRRKSKSCIICAGELKPLSATSNTPLV